MPAATTPEKDDQLSLLPDNEEASPPADDKGEGDKGAPPPDAKKHKAGDVVDGVTLSEAAAAVLNGDDKPDENDDGLDKKEDRREDWWKSDPTLNVFKDAQAMAKSYKELKSLLGKQGKVAPEKYADDAVPAGLKLSDEQVAAFKNVNMTDSQLKVALGLHAQEAARYQGEIQKTQIKLEEMTLRAEWGKGYEERFRTAAQFAIEKYGKDGARKLFATAAGVKNAEIEMRASAGNRMIDDDTTGGAGGSEVTQADIIAYRNKFTDNEFRNNPGAQKKYEEMNARLAAQRGRRMAA